MPFPSTLTLGKHIDCVPVIHGRCIFAQESRKYFLEKNYQCIAVELPPSLGPSVVEAVSYLPQITAVVYRDLQEHCYVPVEPGEAIMEAIRLGTQERAVIEFVDMELDVLPDYETILPDEYAIQKIGLPGYYEKVFPLLPQARPGSVQDQREVWMATKLRELEARFSRILFVCGMAHLEGVRRHFKKVRKPERVEKPDYTPRIFAVHPDSIYLLTGEIPYITFLYEKTRYAMDMKEFEKTDGIKEVLLETRKEYCRDFPEEQELLSPGSMQSLLNYLRNLCLIQSRLTPSMYDLAVASQGVGGSGFGSRVIEMAKFYPYQDPLSPLPVIRIGIGKGWFEPEGEVDLKNRLPGPPYALKSLRLEKRPRLEKKEKWKRHWGSNSECSWPEEDERIENFTRHVRLKALGLMGEDQAKVQKFTSSIKDGLDIRETLRQWHTGEVYVKELPPVRGDVGAVIFIFDQDDEKYPWRSTWLAEHSNESTLCFYATDYKEDIVGPGIARSLYGGALFIFPPIVILDIWRDPSFKEIKDPSSKLVAAGLHYSSSRYVAYVAASRPKAEMQAMSRKLKKHLIYLPLSGFSGYTLHKLRKFHVLQGAHIRGFAQEYIR